MTRPIQQTNVHGIRMMAFSVMGHNGKTILTIEEVRRNCMSHFTAEYMDRVSAILHNVLTPTWFYKQEIIEIPGLVTAVFITYDGLRDDSREIRDQCSWQDFQQRLLAISDWGLEPEFLKEMIQKNSAMVMGGWQRRTIYLMRAGSRPEHWTADKANEDVLTLLMSSAQTTG